MKSGSQMEIICSAVAEEQLYDACFDGQMDVIDSLLELGVDVNALVEKELSLHIACMNTNPWAIDVVTKLITHGADVDLDDKFGWNALNCALFTNPFQPHIAQLLLDCSKKGINRLNIDNRNYFRTTDSLESVKFLVENGINVNHVRDDKTYLDVANDNEIEYLRSVGAKLYSEL